MLLWVKTPPCDGATAYRLEPPGKHSPEFSFQYQTNLKEQNKKQKQNKQTDKNHLVHLKIYSFFFPILSQEIWRKIKKNKIYILKLHFKYLNFLKYNFIFSSLLNFKYFTFRNDMVDNFQQFSWVVTETAKHPRRVYLAVSNV